MMLTFKSAGTDFSLELGQYPELRAYLPWFSSSGYQEGDHKILFFLTSERWPLEEEVEGWERVVLLFTRNIPRGTVYTNIVQVLDLSQQFDRLCLVNLIDAERRQLSLEDEMKTLLVGEHFKMDRVSSALEEGLGKIKSLHHKLIPGRFSKTKGAKIFMKFMSGQGPGGEFFDAWEGADGMIGFMVNCQNYLLSTQLVSSFIRFKSGSYFSKNDLGSFFKDYLQENEESLMLPAEKGCDLLVFRLNYARNQIEMFSNRAFDIINHQGKVEEKIEWKPMKGHYWYGQYHDIPKNHRLYFVSPGFRKSWVDLCPGQVFAHDLKLGEMRETVEDLFFKLSRGNREDFLPRDSMIISLEMERHGLAKVN